MLGKCAELKQLQWFVKSLIGRDSDIRLCAIRCNGLDVIEMSVSNGKLSCGNIYLQIHNMLPKRNNLPRDLFLKLIHMIV